MPSKDEGAAIWEDVVPTIKDNNGELLLPLQMVKSLGESGTSYLKDRLSQYLSENGKPVQVIGFVDETFSCYRVMRVPTFPGDSKIASSGLMKNSAKPAKVSAATKKLKIPRPPNAFILFRAYRYPQLKAQCPKLHNNDISIILGREWRESSEQTKNYFREQAEVQKAQHAAMHPGYQYAPRKPSEKKRRMTAKKAARLAHSQISPPGAGVNTKPTIDEDIDASLGTPRSEVTQDSPVISHEDGSLEFILPTSFNAEIQAATAAHNASIVPDGNFVPLRPNRSASSAMPDAMAHEQSFFDSCVDWKKIAADLEMIQNLGDSQLVQDNGDGFGNLVIGPLDDPTLFEDDLERMGRLF